MSTNERRGWIIAAVAAVAFALAIAASQVGGSSSTDHWSQEGSPSSAPMLMRVIYSDGDIRHHSHRNRWRETTSSRSLMSAGPADDCFVQSRDEWGDSLTRDHVVRGTGHFHFCINSRNHARLSDFWASFDAAGNWAQLWKLDWSQVASESATVWSTTWCAAGVSCYPVQRHTLEFRWQFVRHVPYLNLPQHATFYETCTVRGDAPGIAHGHNVECYSGWVH